MPDRSRLSVALLRLTPVVGVGLLAYLLSTVNPRAITANTASIGWGLLFVIALAGVSHVIKTWAWRLTLQREAGNVSFARTLGLRLVSEAIGQFGFVGMIGGEAARVSLLGSGVSTEGAISSVTLDRSLFIVAGALVTMAGVIGLLLAASVSHAVQYYAVALLLGLLLMLILGALAMKQRWLVISSTVRALARLRWFRNWLGSKEQTLIRAEQRLLGFYAEAPRAFWCSLFLNLICHFFAIAEVYIIVRMLGAPATLLGALILESLTKLINAAGSVNPGNVGTYEGGTMVIGRLVRLTSTQGLLLAFCRRLRAVFWAIVGGLCFLWISRRRNSPGPVCTAQTGSQELHPSDAEPDLEDCESRAVFILAHDASGFAEFEPASARVATLPVLLRGILSVQAKCIVRTIVVANRVSSNAIWRELHSTYRLPEDIEWLQVDEGASLSHVLRMADVRAERSDLIRGDFIYRPDIFRALSEWDGKTGAVEFLSSGQPIGIFGLGRETAEKLAAERDLNVVTPRDLHQWIAEQLDNQHGASNHIDVADDSWQAITCPGDLITAESKLNSWLVKPTDGIFARMNRQVSIPISRWLIKFPVTPNMVSVFTLALSLVAAALFALGGYWNCLSAAVLGVWGSILDGCDGEVARLKLQASDFGCWLDTMCDYTYYFVTFAGIIIGVARSTRDPYMTGVAIAIFAGALLTFIWASIGRSRLSGRRPEQYLQIWQKHAETQKSSLVLRMARQTEFIVRRCFLPYLLLALAVLNLMHALVYMIAFGANVAWMVSLRSLLAFSRISNAGAKKIGSHSQAGKALVAKSEAI